MSAEEGDEVNWTVEDSGKASALSNGRKSMTPKKSKSRASIKSRTTPPQLRRRSSAKDNEMSDSDGGETPISKSTSMNEEDAATHVSGEDKLHAAVSGIVEETPSAVKLLESQVMEKSSATVITEDGAARAGHGDKQQVSSGTHIAAVHTPGIPETTVNGRS